MNNLFDGRKYFDEHLSGWDTSDCVDMANMFGVV